MTFKRAQPVWVDNQSSLSQFLGFYAAIEQSVAVTGELHIAAVNAYRLWHNGKFVAHGPARCAHGYARVDVIAIDLSAGENHFAIEVAGYHVNSFEHLDQPAFVCAELQLDGEVLLATGDDFQARVIVERLRDVQRYSFQRPCSEAYILDSNSFDWMQTGVVAEDALSLQVVDGYTFLARQAPMPVYPQISGHLISSWKCSYEIREDYKLDRALRQTGSELKGCMEENLELKVRQILDGCSSSQDETLESGLMQANTALIYDLGRNRSGFLQVKLTSSAPTHVIVIFDERLNENDDVDFTRLDCLNAVSFQLQAGDYVLESFAPYTARYVRVHVLAGDCNISNCGMRVYENPQMFFDVSTGDPLLDEISIAAQHTIAQNSVDFFTDCPSRERAGWLCDSFFMGRYERELAKVKGVEHDFLENFLLPDSFAYLPAGMLPMCYPADHYNGCFIPQWALWYVLEFVEFMTGDKEHSLAELAKERLLKLFSWFASYENSDGLLEDLPGWNFIEWSKANSFVKGVNYPTNMLYVAALRAYGNYFAMDSFIKKADAIQKTIIEQAWDGEWFKDQALRDESDNLKVQEHRTEVCQYYALTFGIKPDGWKKMWQRLVVHFGSYYDKDGMFRDVYPANAFIGYVLRIDLLQQLENPTLCLKEIKELYGHMAQTTGTLWEHKDTSASCNHGFAGYIALKIQQLSSNFEINDKKS